MSDALYRIDIKFGTIVLSEPTGRMIPCQGGLTLEMTDAYELDQNGIEVPGSRKQGESGIIMQLPLPIEDRPWWRIWA